MANGVPAALAFTLYRGEAYRLRFTLLDTVDADGNAIDISAWTTVFTIRSRDDAADPPMLQKAGAVYDQATRRFVVSLSASESLALRVGSWRCSFARVDVGSEDLLGIGSLAVKYDVTHPK